jgi:hypothetical protein
VDASGSGDLDMGQSLALLVEDQSAQNLLPDATSAIARMRHPVIDSDAVFTLASIGVEKLMKITLGLLHLRDKAFGPQRGS